MAEGVTQLLAGRLDGWAVMVGAWTLAPEALWEGVEPPAGAVSEG